MCRHTLPCCAAVLKSYTFRHRELLRFHPLRLGEPWRFRPPWENAVFGPPCFVCRRILCRFAFHSVLFCHFGRRASLGFVCRSAPLLFRRNKFHPSGLARCGMFRTYRRMCYLPARTHSLVYRSHRLYHRDSLSRFLRRSGSVYLRSICPILTHSLH